MAGAPPSPSHPSTALRIAAAVIAAVASGLCVATVDTLAARAQLPRFIPDGAGLLWLFLSSLYGAALGGVAVLSALLALWLTRHTPLSRLWTSEASPPPVVVPLWAGLLSIAVALGLVGAALHPTTWTALVRFHHRELLSILVGVAGGGILIAAVLVGLCLLSLLPATGRKLELRFAGPRSVYAIGWILGLLGFCATVAWRLLALQRMPQLPLQGRALQLAITAPLLAIAALTVGHGIGRTLARRLPTREAGRGLDSRSALILLPSLLVLCAAGIVALRFAEPLSILDWRVLRSTGIGLLLAIVFVGPLSRRVMRPGLVVLLALPFVLYGAALGLGRSDRVRKAALALAPLAERLVTTLGTVADLDGDGVAGRLAVGGSDCDDLDAERHPGAFDWPDNGVDENCNDHDATATPRRSAPAAMPPPDSLIKRPNILLITVDALRADHVSAYGYKRRTTPALDALAAGPDGVLFRSAWAHAPSTRYSVPAILTGRYPSTVAWGPPHVHWPPEVLPENRLLSEILHDAGYSTTALLSYHYFERGWGLSQGFDDYDTHLMNLHSLGGDPAATSGSSARELADLALTKLEPLVAASSQRPFFLWVHFYDPHYRYETHAPPPGEVSFGDGEIDLYDGEIRYTDQHIGRILDFLQKSPAWARTAVVVTADHGEGFGEHGIGPDRRHGYHLYANQTKVPLILRLPGLPAAQRIDTPVGHVDIAPTVAQLLTGEDVASKEPQLLGHSLLPLLSKSDRPDAVVFQEVMYEGPTVRKALVSDRWHLIQNLIPDGTTELYDLLADPGEDRDRFGLEPATETTLGKRLSAWLDDSAVPANFAQRVSGNLSKTPLSASSPVGAHIGDFLEVVAVDAPSAPLGRSDTATVTVIYRVNKRIAPGYRLFTHLRGGGRAVNLDHDFVDGLVPPQRLQPGTWVRDVIRLSVPPWFPSGPASLLVGLYRRDQRVPVSGPDDRVVREDRAVQAARIQIR